MGRIYKDTGPVGEPRPPSISADEERRGLIHRLSPRALAGIGAIGVLFAVGVAMLIFFITRANREVVVFAHRGASVDAPENTLAAFRLEIDQGADYVEFDVQESSDSEVVVVHESDLMKLGGAAKKVWDSTAAELRAVDIGGHLNPRYAGERVPTLAEALAVIKGRARAAIELKWYGHNKELEEKVAAHVEAAVMEKDCFIMSLDEAMVVSGRRCSAGSRCSNGVSLDHSARRGAGSLCACVAGLGPAAA